MSERELIEQLVKLQITQTTLLTRLLETNLNRTAGATRATEAEVEGEDADPSRPLQIGDRVTLLTVGRFRVTRDTICTVIKIGTRVTVTTPTGTKIVRAAHNLRRVTK